MKCLATYCSGIEVLNLHSCDVRTLFNEFRLGKSTKFIRLLLQTITDQSVIKIAEKCFQLKQLCVSKCPDLTDNTLLSLAQHNRSCLNTLEVAGCNQFTDLGFQALGRVSFYQEVNGSLNFKSYEDFGRKRS